MRIGFTTLFAWRPHVEHTHFLAKLARQGGHETRFLRCDADLSSCYTHELRPHQKRFLQCTACRLGGLSSFESAGGESIGRLARLPVELPADSDEWSRSSASTIRRFESDQEYQSSEFIELAERLRQPTEKAYTAALNWIQQEKLDGLVLFNGRMDGTRGVMEAARTAGVPFVSLERTWFGDGIQLLPNENCLGLQAVNQMMREWRDVPLTGTQALKAASHVASRFLKRNQKEWRAYNTSAKVSEWPVSDAGRRVLLVPGSRNEIWGHPDWASDWGHFVQGADALMQRWKLRPHEVVLRCHPNWGERIGGMDGHSSERFYQAWAAERGIHCIDSRDTTSTLGLIEQCDAVVVSGGSAALEAGILGKQVLALGPSIYQDAGFQTDVMSPQTLADAQLDTDLSDEDRRIQSKRVAQLTLRFTYAMVYRVAQFVDQVRCETTTRYRYHEGADPDRLIQLFRTGQLIADDPSRAKNDLEEAEVLEQIRRRRWEEVLSTAQTMAKPSALTMAIQRRWMFRPIDHLRARLPRGDQ